MSKPTTDEFNDFLTGAQNKIKSALKAKADQALKESKQFLEESKADMKRWLKQLKSKKITPSQFKWLSRGKLNVAKLEALKQSGMGLVELQNLKNSLIDLAIKKASDSLPKK